MVKFIRITVLITVMMTIMIMIISVGHYRDKKHIFINMWAS